MTSGSPEIQRRRRQLREQLRALTFAPLMRGSIVEVRQRCGRSNCACAKDPKARHPRKLLTVHLDGRTQTVHLRAADEERVRQAIDGYGRAWEAIDGLTACELLDLRRSARQRRLGRARERQTEEGRK